jgi:sugar/nucleoside kinase (ribokinase family)
MNSRSGILCGGAWCVDRNITLNSWPPQETVATMLQQSDFGGCPGHNMSTALKRLGATFPISAQGLVGDDEFGRLLFRTCDDMGVERSMLEMRSGIDTSFTLAMTAQDSGKRTFFHLPGALPLQTPDDFDFSKTKARFLHLGLPGLHPILDGPWQGETSGWASVLKKARAAGLQTNMELVSIEPEKIRHTAEAFLGFLDMLVINDVEVGAIAGIETVTNGTANFAAVHAAVERLMQRFPLQLIVVHSPLGAVAMTRAGEIAEQPSVNVPQAVIKGSNGAGDCFAAGILFGQHEGWSLKESLKLAHASAAMSLRSTATTATVEPWQACLAQADQWGWRA